MECGIKGCHGPYHRTIQIGSLKYRYCRQHFTQIMKDIETSSDNSVMRRLLLNSRRYSNGT